MRAICCAVMTMLLALLLAAPSRAQSPKPPHITPALVAEAAAPRPGAATTVALAMEPAKGWHGYWKNPGDSGVEPTIEWTLPPGVTIGPMAFPVPGTLMISGLMNYVYEGPYAHLMELRVAGDVAPGTPLPIRGKANWLACTHEICVPESADIAITLKAGSGAIEPAARTRFDGWRAALPRPLGGEGTFAVEGKRLRLAAPLPAAMPVTEAYFFALTDGALNYAAPQRASRDGDRLLIETEAGVSPPDRIEGVLKIGRGQGLSLSARRGAVAGGGTPIGTAAQGGAGDRLTILAALGGALLGGLLLNIMPCVFPILSLKALSLASAGGGATAARADALAYTTGAVLTCAALGAALLALRAGGEAAGWAFQLQHPAVIVALLLLVAAIALNLAGLFELPAVTGGGSLAAKPGASGAFFTGALAAFVATPCTGPFMGAALGAALVLPVAAAMAVFVGLGLGLGLPFLLLGFVPSLRRRLPRPGPWMERLRRILSLPMFATALGLAWILGRQAGVEGMTVGIGLTLLLGLALWWVGARQASGRRSSWWPAAGALALCAGAIAVGMPRAPAEAAKGPAIAGAEPFSEARLAALRASSRPVFVYFTADWCLTCKVNEKGAIERAEVARAFARGKVAVLVGDWTRGDATIGRFLAAHGRSGVPLYLFYPAGGGPRVLPQILTPSTLTALVG